MVTCPSPCRRLRSRPSLPRTSSNAARTRSKVIPRIRATTRSPHVTRTSRLLNRHLPNSEILLIPRRPLHLELALDLPRLSLPRVNEHLLLAPPPSHPPPSQGKPQRLPSALTPFSLLHLAWPSTKPLISYCKIKCTLNKLYIASRVTSPVKSSAGANSWRLVGKPPWLETENHRFQYSLHLDPEQGPRLGSYIRLETWYDRNEVPRCWWWAESGP